MDEDSNRCQGSLAAPRQLDQSKKVAHQEEDAPTRQVTGAAGLVCHLCKAVQSSASRAVIRFHLRSVRNEMGSIQWLMHETRPQEHGKYLPSIGTAT